MGLKAEDVYSKLSKKITNAQLGIGSIETVDTETSKEIVVKDKEGSQVGKLTFTQPEDGKNADVTVKESTNDTLILTFSKSDGTTFDTPNLHGKNTKVEVTTNTDDTYIIKFTNSDGTEILSPNLKGTIVTAKDNVNNTEYIKKVDIVTNNGGTETTYTTPNLEGESIIFKPNSDNDISNIKRVYKLDMYKIVDGEEVFVRTTDNLIGSNALVRATDTNTEYSYKLDIEQLDGTNKTVFTTPELNGRRWWIGNVLQRNKDENGIFIDKITHAITNSNDGDLYLSTSDNSVWIRKDDTVKNKWIYKYTIMPKNNYELWTSIEEYKDKSIVEYQNWLRNSSIPAQIAWEKPNLYDDTTSLNTNYYYKIDTKEHGKGSARLNRFNIPSDKDYPIGKYAYFNGVKYLLFETTESGIPALTLKDTYSFYCLYDEKNKTTYAHKVNIADGTDTEVGTSAIPVTESMTLPEGYMLVEPNGYIQYGTWIITCYVSSSTKDQALEYTSSAGQSLEGYVTSEVFNSILGTGNLETIATEVKPAINELNKLLRGLTHDELNNTDFDNVVDAINKIDEREFINAGSTNGDIKTFASSLITKHGALKNVYFYCKGCTSVPASTNGWGYATLKISQDVKYALLIYDSDTNKSYTCRLGDGVWDTDWITTYAPTTSGTSGQILQSNGSDVPPTWIDNVGIKEHKSGVANMAIIPTQGSNTINATFIHNYDYVLYNDGRLEINGYLKLSSPSSLSVNGTWGSMYFINFGNVNKVSIPFPIEFTDDNVILDAEVVSTSGSGWSGIYSARYVNKKGWGNIAFYRPDSSSSVVLGIRYRAVGTRTV